MTIQEQDRAVLREAWTTYCDALRDEGMDIINGVSGDPVTPGELAEALRAVARIGVMSLQHRMDFNDPDFPLLFRTMDDRFKYGGPDPHINYLNATLRGDATYRLHGNHMMREFNVNVSTPVPVEVDGQTKKILGSKSLWQHEMKFEEDGSFDVMFSAEKQPGNWMPLDPDFRGGTELPDQYPMAAGGITMRTYYMDPADQRPNGTFFLERVDKDAPLVPTPLTPARLAEQVKSAAALCRKAAKWWIARPGRARTQNKPNVIAPPGKYPPGIESYSRKRDNNAPLNYGVCTFDLASDEALLIETNLAPMLYWSFTLYNAWWESPDVQDRQTSIGHTAAFVDADGRFRAVIAHDDPGVPNWLDTGGGRRGFLFYRWLKPVDLDNMPAPSGKIVKLKDVRGLMPAGHPHIDTATRRKQLSERRAWFARRFQT